LIAAALILSACAASTDNAFVAGRGFAEPREVRSHDGVLKVTLRAQKTSFDVSGRKVRGFAYDRSYVGPTLRVKPGDTMEITLVNDLGEPTNLHEHGMHVSPIDISDNVLRVMRAGDSKVRVKVPRDIDPGTYWYHPHLHGFVEKQVFSGMSGVLLVDGLTERLAPALRGLPDHLVALKDLQLRDGAIVNENIDSGAPTTRTVNGLVRPTLEARTNATQLLRLANIGADIWYRIVAQGARFGVIAEDANPVGRVWRAKSLVLPPGKRYDVIVRWPKAGTYDLKTLEFNQGPDGDQYPERLLARIKVAGAAVTTTRWPTSLGPMPSLGDAQVARKRVLTFSENPKTNQFFIDGKQFDATRIDQVVKRGDVEEWTVRNVSRELHPFHIHVNDFQVMAVNGKPYRARGEQDTVSLPIGGSVRIRMRYARFLGAYVYHCHILAHEDNGMMGILDVTRTGKKPSAATLRGLRDMRDAMPAARAGHGT
jgi:FtsP/CotA-like multicopper oxidase with cupredoxin domain